MNVGVQHHSPAGLPPGMTGYPLYRTLDGPVWMGVENLAPTGIRSPDRPTRSESLCRLSYPGPLKKQAFSIKRWNVYAALPMVTTEHCFPFQRYAHPHPTLSNYPHNTRYKSDDLVHWLQYTSTSKHNYQTKNTGTVQLCSLMKQRYCGYRKIITIFVVQYQNQ